MGSYEIRETKEILENAKQDATPHALSRIGFQDRVLHLNRTHDNLPTMRAELLSHDAAQRLTISQQAHQLARARTALTAAGYTLKEGAECWKPPLGPSASPLLEKIDRQAQEIERLQERIYKYAHWTPEHTIEEWLADRQRIVEAKQVEADTELRRQLASMTAERDALNESVTAGIRHRQDYVERIMQLQAQLTASEHRVSETAALVGRELIDCWVSTIKKSTDAVKTINADAVSGEPHQA